MLTLLPVVPLLRPALLGTFLYRRHVLVLEKIWQAHAILPETCVLWGVGAVTQVGHGILEKSPKI